MIIFGFGRRRVKDCGEGATYTCPNCHNTSRFRLLIRRTWFTLFFIPVIPYETAYLELCPVCRYGGEIKKADFEAKMADAAADKSYITTS